MKINVNAIVSAIIYIIGIFIIPMYICYSFAIYYPNGIGSDSDLDLDLMTYILPWYAAWILPTLIFIIYRVEKFLFIRLPLNFLVKVLRICLGVFLIALSIPLTLFSFVVGYMLWVPIISIKAYFAVGELIPLVLLIKRICKPDTRTIVLGISLLCSLMAMYFL